MPRWKVGEFAMLKLLQAWDPRGGEQERFPIPAQTHRCGTVCLPAARDNEQWTVKDLFPEPIFGITGASVVLDLTAQWQVSTFGKWTNNESILFNFSFNMEFGILVVFSCVTTCLSCSVSCVCDPLTMLS